MNFKKTIHNCSTRRNVFLGPTFHRLYAFRFNVMPIGTGQTAQWSCGESEAIGLHNKYSLRQNYEVETLIERLAKAAIRP